MNRPNLQWLAEQRVAEATALLDAGLWSGAYYMAGYAIECGLKSCILARVERTGVIFLEKRFLEQCWTHDFETLSKAADLEVVRGLDISANPRRGDYWLLLSDWSEQARYGSWLESQARAIHEAITDPVDGVMEWVKKYW